MQNEQKKPTLKNFLQGKLMEEIPVVLMENEFEYSEMSVLVELLVMFGRSKFDAKWKKDIKKLFRKKTSSHLWWESILTKFVSDTKS